MKKRIIRVTKKQLNEMMLMEDGEITITDKVSPQGFAAAQNKSRTTGAQINVALGSTTNSNGGDGVEAKLDPNDTTTNTNNNINAAKQTGLETSFVAPIENFNDYNQMKAFSDKVSNTSGIDESKKISKGRLLEMKKEYLLKNSKTYEKKDFYNRGNRR